MARVGYIKARYSEIKKLYQHLYKNLGKSLYNELFHGITFPTSRDPESRYNLFSAWFKKLSEVMVLNKLFNKEIYDKMEPVLNNPDLFSFNFEPLPQQVALRAEYPSRLDVAEFPSTLDDLLRANIVRNFLYYESYYKAWLEYHKVRGV